MNASKENGQRALECFIRINHPANIGALNLTGPKKFVREFLEAAIRKLPSEQAFADDAKRRRAKARSA